MLIDKSKFLLLVTALSAATTACVIKSTGDGNDDGSGGSTTEGTTTSQTTTATGTTTATTTTGTSTTTATGTGGGEACLDDSADEPTCSSTCEGVTNCNALAYLKGEVAVDAAPCINALVDGTCSVLDARQCMYDSLAKACFDTAETHPICTNIATACAFTDDQTWQDDCQVRLDGLNDSGRTVYTDCMTEGCDLDACALALFQ